MGNELELTWYGKDEQIKVEPRLLIHDSAKDYGEKETENMLIHGDNLLALKALEKDSILIRPIIQVVRLNIMMIIWNTVNGLVL